MFEVYLSHEAEKIYLKANPKTTRLLDHCFKNLEESPLFGPNIKRLKVDLKGVSVTKWEDCESSMAWI